MEAGERSTAPGSGRRPSSPPSQRQQQQQRPRRDPRDRDKWQDLIRVKPESQKRWDTIKIVLRSISVFCGLALIAIGVALLNVEGLMENGSGSFNSLNVLGVMIPVRTPLPPPLLSRLPSYRRA